jgi:hypothetical protein
MNPRESFAVLRSQLATAAEPHGEGTREYIRVLRLVERHPLGSVQRALGSIPGASR